MDSGRTTLTLQKLRCLKAVADEASVTLAARAIQITQPVVSVHVRDLEEHFGAKLFYQDGRRMLLTEAGRLVYEYACDVLSAAEDTRNMVRLLGTAHAGKALVGATESPGSYRLPASLADFNVDHPQAELSLSVGDAWQIWEQTRQGLVDFSVVAGPPPPGDFEVSVFSNESLTLVCAPSHPLAGRTVTMADVRDQPLVSATRRVLFDERLHAFGLENSSVAIRMGSAEGIKRAVERGLGIAVMFRCAVDIELASGDLSSIEVATVQVTRPFYVIHSPNKRFSPLQIRLLSFLKASPQPSDAATSTSS